MHASPARTSVLGASQHSGTAAFLATGGSQPSKSTHKHLRGKYASFFNSNAHAEIEEWYNTVADKEQRTQLKILVHEILALDFQTQKKDRLRLVTNEPDIVGANAIFRAHGAKFFTPESALRAVEYLSIASVVQKNQYRNVFGRIIPMSLNQTKRNHEYEFNPANKFLKSDSARAPCQAIIGKEHVHRPSFPIDAPTEVIGISKTHHDQMFVWKMPAKSILKAAPIVNTNTPWGTLDTGDIDRKQWRSVSNEMFDNSLFAQNPKTRLFQNYNENYCRLLSSVMKEQKMSKRAAARTLDTSSTLPQLSNPRGHSH